MLLPDDIGGISAADLPTQTIPSDAPPGEVAGSEAARAAELDRLADELGCKLKDGPGVFTTSCQNLLRELARARGNAERALAALLSDPSLRPLLPWLVGGLGAIGIKVGYKIVLKYGRIVVVAAKQVGDRAAKEIVRYGVDAWARCVEGLASAWSSKDAFDMAKAAGRCLQMVAERK